MAKDDLDRPAIVLSYIRAEGQLAIDLNARLAVSQEVVEAARQTYAVPAQEQTNQAIQKTKQTEEKTKQDRFRHTAGVLCFIVASGVMYFEPLTAWPLAVALGIFGGAAAAPDIIKQLKSRDP